MFRHLWAFAVVPSVLAGAIASSAAAADPSEQLLPMTTKGFVSIPDVQQLREKWNETQLGQLMQDPVMAPFIDDLKQQIRTKLSRTDDQLGITWDELQGVCGGELCIAVTQPWHAELEDRRTQAKIDNDLAVARQRGNSEKQIEELRQRATKRYQDEQEKARQASRAMILLVDVTGYPEEAADLLERVAKKLEARGAARDQKTIAGIEVVRYELSENGETHSVFYCIHNQRLVATDHPGVANDVLHRLVGTERPVLADSPAFEAAMQQEHDVFGDHGSHLRWFIEPFGYVEVTRAYEGGRRRRGTDLLRVLSNQGFTAVQGAGGQITFSTDEHQILHHSFVYAPEVEDPTTNAKYRLAANVLDFSNQPNRQPEFFLPATLSSYLTLNWKMKRAFEFLGSLVDEIAGDEVFEDVLKSIESDPNGPQINIRKELVQHLGERVTMVSDYREPITTKSERLLFAVEVSDPATVMETVNKAMESDPAARKRDHRGQTVWEILNEAPVEVEAVKIEGGGFGFDFDEPEVVEESDKPIMPNSAVTVAYGYLLIATNIDYLIETLDRPAGEQQLQKTADYDEVQRALEKLGMDDVSFRFFTRTDEAYRTSYELTRQGKMPESESLYGKLLNRIWEPAEEGQVREQVIDGAKMPEYSKVERYLGPGGLFVRSVDDGWSIIGCLLAKQP